jgi:hypothetical protein
VQVWNDRGECWSLVQGCSSSNLPRKLEEDIGVLYSSRFLRPRPRFLRPPLNFWDLEINQKLRPISQFSWQQLTVQENFSKGGRAGIFDLYPVVLYLFVRCFLISFGGRFGRVSRGTLPILTTMHAVLIKLHHEYVLLRRFFFYFDWELCSIYPSQGYIERPGTAQLL